MPRRRLRCPPLSEWSLRTRVTVAATVIVGCLLSLALLGFYLMLHWTLEDQLSRRGRDALYELSAFVRLHDPRGEDVLRTQIDGFNLLQSVDDQDRVLASSASLVGYPPISRLHPSRPGETVSEHLTVRGIPYKIFVSATRVRAQAGWRTVYAGTPEYSYAAVRRLLAVSLGVGVPLSMAVMAWLVWTAVRRALSPMRTMSAELADISGGEPYGRVTVPGGHDEIAELGEEINLALMRLQRTVERQRAFTADVSHELRSPLTGLRAQLEDALDNPEDEQWPVVARAALDDADRLQRIVADLLLMARLEAGVQMERRLVDLGELAREELTRRRGEVPIELSAEPGVVVLGSPDHLRRLLVNLLDNAEHYARSRVWVRVRAIEPRIAELEVLDDGPGIAPEDRERVFLRFQRLGGTRRREHGGTGLGLPISRDIAIVHGGSLNVVDSDLGARLQLHLPLARPHER
ncbi:HAMP domain-containing sensor histidine kinase [Actinomadura keratinilytica]|uniref:histidine kinase n=1 Tax=Actinomadura keratinilytica TaxID=547461 RepID=A0ABP7YV30_9ACTN